MGVKQWWIHSDYNIEDETWFVPCKIATRNMWEQDNPKVVHVVEYEPMRKKIIELECEANKYKSLLLEMSKLK